MYLVPIFKILYLVDGSSHDFSKVLRIKQSGYMIGRSEIRIKLSRILRKTLLCEGILGRLGSLLWANGSFEGGLLKECANHVVVRV
jgi:hypothetical protein